MGLLFFKLGFKCKKRPAPNAGLLPYKHSPQKVKHHQDQLSKNLTINLFVKNIPWLYSTFFSLYKDKLNN